LYPGEKYQVFPTEGDVTLPIGNVFIRSEYVSSGQNIGKSSELANFHKIKDDMKLIHLQNETMLKKHSELEDKCVEYEQYI
jgi:hypothetical protein